MQDLALLALGTAGWLVAALVVGLYLGERGRRRDAQRREGVLRVDAPAKPTVRIPPTSPVPQAMSDDMNAARKRYVDAGVAEGFKAKDLEADFDEMMAAASSDNVGVVG